MSSRELHSVLDTSLSCRDLQRKVEAFARKERDRNEKFDNSELSVTYPDPNEP